MQLARTTIAGLVLLIASISPTLLSSAIISSALISAAFSNETNADSNSDPEEIQRLILQLGARNYSQRKYAESVLREMGHVAIDQLIEAQYASSPEISLAAQQLLGRLEIRWTAPDDPPITAEIMRDYENKSSEDRQETATWLAELHDGAGFDVAARIVRYDRSDLVAKHAALELIKYVDVDSRENRISLETAVDMTLRDCPRVAAEWLVTFVQHHKDPSPDTIAEMRKLIARESSELNEVRTSSEITAELYMALAEMADRLKNDALVSEAIAGHLNLVKNDEYSVVKTAYWLLDHDHEAMLQKLIFDPFDKLTKTLPQLLYCAAEAARDDDRERAEQMAQDAFELTAKNVDEDATKTFFLRRSTTFGLEQRGLTDWSIREYKRLVASDDRQDWRIDYYRGKATEAFAELLHDRQRHLEAADILAELLGADGSDDELPQGPDRDQTSKLARMHYFRSEHYRKQGDRENQIKSLKRAFEADSSDADVLIAMHRLPRADSEWKSLTNQRIQVAVSNFERDLNRMRGTQASNRFQAALTLNQIAWLVGNTGSAHTEAVRQKAVEQSRRSIELRPRAAGYLDTLGRTYFSIGDTSNAIKYQRLAVKLEPFSQQIVRQLEEFESSLANSRNSTPGETEK